MRPLTESSKIGPHPKATPRSAGLLVGLIADNPLETGPGRPSHLESACSMAVPRLPLTKV